MRTILRTLAAISIAASGTVTLASEPLVRDVDTNDYPRITDSDIHMLLLSRVAEDWSDREYVLHLYGTPQNHLNEFEKRDRIAAEVATIPSYRAQVTNLANVRQFSIGVIGADFRRRTLAGALGMWERNPDRFRLMRGYTENDLPSPMGVGSFDFSSSSFPVSGGHLPCDSTSEVSFRYGHMKPPLAFAFRTWLPPKAPKTTCQVQIDDAQSARKIEEARHEGTLVVGVVFYARMSELVEGGEHLIEVDRIDFDFYKNPGSARYFRHLGKGTLVRPWGPADAESIRSRVGEPSAG